MIIGRISDIRTNIWYLVLQSSRISGKSVSVVFSKQNITGAPKKGCEVMMIKCLLISWQCFGSVFN